MSPAALAPARGKADLAPVSSRAPADPRGRSRARQQQAWLLVLLAVLSLSCYYAFSRYVVSSVVVQGRSMQPTLQDGERCILDRWTLQHRSPQRGDIVVIKDPGHNDCAVKRVVALPGEQVQLTRGAVYINGQPLSEPYLAAGVITLCPESKEQLVWLGPDHYFVLGDNRPYSEDSRFYGALPRHSIIGLISK